MFQTNTNSISKTDAISLIRIAAPDFTINKVVDYKNFYVFDLQPKGVTEQVYIGLAAVCKENGNIVNFNPVLYDYSEYIKTAEKTPKFVGD